MVHSKEFFDVLSSVPRVTHVAHLQTQRGAAFRTERFPEFKELEVQMRAAATVRARRVKTIVAIGGNGTCAGIKALAKVLEAQQLEPVQTFFVPVTIDSDIQA